MDGKEAFRTVLESEDYVSKMHKLSWRTLSSLFQYFLSRILSARHVENADVESLMGCLGVVFVRKYMYEFRLPRREAVRVSKIYMLERIIRVASDKLEDLRNNSNNQRLIKINDAFVRNMNRCLNSLMTTVRRTSSGGRRRSSGGRRVSSIVVAEKKNRFVNVIGKLDLENVGLFNASMCCLLSKYGAELQESFLLDRLAERVASRFFKMAQRSGRIDFSQFDPLVGDTSCQIRATVIAATPILGKLHFFFNFNFYLIIMRYLKL